MLNRMTRKIGNGLILFDPHLMKCIAEKRNKETQYYLKSIKSSENSRDCRGASLLHVAAEYDNEEIVKYLIASGFDINLQDKHGRTALFIAVKKRHFATAKVLLDLNADFYICDMFGISALRMAIMADPMILPMDRVHNTYPKADCTDVYWQVIAMMLNRVDVDCSSDSEVTANQLLQIHCPLTHVVFMNNSEVMRIMIEKGSPIEAKDCFVGKTALHWAVEFWKLDKVKILLDCGADINALSYSSNTPLMHIYHQDHDLETVTSCEVELLTILLRHKPKFLSTIKIYGPNLADQLESIFRCGSKDAIRITIMENEDDLLLARCKNENTLLHVVAVNSNSGIEQVIRGRKMNVDDTNKLGETALYRAIMFDNYNMVQFFLSEGASPDVYENQRGINPMHLPFMLADSEKHTAERRLEYIKLMLEYGANIEMRIGMGDLTTTILGQVLKDRTFSLGEPVIAQFAMRQALGVPISQVTREKIQSHSKFETHFDSCVNQLEQARSSVIFGSVTVFDILTTDSGKIILLYARNRGLASNLSILMDQLKVDPYYMGILRKRFSKISEIAKSREEAETMISQIIGKFYECNSIVTRTIVEFLDDEDVQKLLGKVV